MPFIDFNSASAQFIWGSQDCVIVGAGAAGILLAIKLKQKGKRVLILESGHFSLDEERQSLNQIEQSGKTLQNPVWARKRVLGGTTVAWGGQSLPFTPLDFVARDWVVNSGWPIQYDALHSHYSHANAFMGVDARNYDSDLFAVLERPDPGFDPSRVHYHFSKWALEPDFLKRGRAELEREVTVLYNAHLTRIDLDHRSTVSAIEIANFCGTRIRAEVNTLVLASGGIETNRILLANDHQMQGGLGNHSGWLGKAFMEHPSIEVGHVESDDMWGLQQTLNTHLHRRRKYSVRLSISEQSQRERRLLNVSAGILCVYRDRIDPFNEVKRLIKSPRLRATARLLHNAPALARSGWALARHGFVFKPGSIATLTFMLEQEPTAASYIALSSRRDVFGVPQARVNWHITQKTWDTVVHFARELAEEFSRLKLGRVVLHPHIDAGVRDWQSYLSSVNHHMGGTRMSDTPEAGVVTRDLQLWGVPNLYVCSASVFPTASHSNPTLTLLALTSRLADRLGDAAVP